MSNELFTPTPGEIDARADHWMFAPPAGMTILDHLDYAAKLAHSSAQLMTTPRNRCAAAVERAAAAELHQRYLAAWEAIHAGPENNRRSA